VLMAPVVPGFTTHPAKLDATIKAIADHGAAFMGANIMYLKEGTKDHFMGFLAKEFPRLVEGYNRLYAGAYAKADYISGVRAMISVLQDRYDLRRRTRGAPGQTELTEPAARSAQQQDFAWADESGPAQDVTPSPPARTGRSRA
jgi:DNA repair photolyase